MGLGLIPIQNRVGRIDFEIGKQSFVMVGDGDRDGSMALTIPKITFDLKGVQVPQAVTGIAHWTIQKQVFGFGAGAVLIDHYSESNQDSYTSLSSTLMQVGQSFTGDGRQLLACYFYVGRINTPTGVCRAKLYAHSGTFDTGTKSSLPTGIPLATSEDVDISTLHAAGGTPSFALAELFFNTPYTPIAGTHYVLTFEVDYTLVNGSNYCIIGYDGSSVPSGMGNYVEYTTGGGWIYVATAATCFYAYNTKFIHVTATWNIKKDTFDFSGTQTTTEPGVAEITVVKQTIDSTGTYVSPAGTSIGHLALNIRKQVFNFRAVSINNRYNGSSALAIGKQTFDFQGNYISPEGTSIGTAAIAVVKQLLSSLGTFSGLSYSALGLLNIKKQTFNFIGTTSYATYTGTAAITVQKQTIDSQGEREISYASLPMTIKKQTFSISGTYS